MSILVFADDIVLINKNTTTAQQQMTMLNSYLTQLGMKLATRKCSTFQIKTSDKTWYLADPRLKVGPKLIPCANSEEVIRYLGITIRPWTGVDSTVDIDSITGAANNIAGMKLKPQQKAQLIKMHLLPRYIHGLVAAPPSIGTLAKIDGEIRQVYKRIFKLHPSTTDGIIYKESNHGSGINMRESTNQSLQELSEQLDKRCSEYAKSLGIPWPATLDNVNEARRNLRRRETERWEQL
ncbi:hypothetical protein HN011_011380, partial [Eciton burchellii]